MFKKILRGEKGFTLVEVIVVAVIVAALAAVAIGVYLNYVDSSRQNATANAGSSLASFCGACINTQSTITDNSDKTNGGGNLTCNNTTSINVPKDVKLTGTINTTASGSVIVEHIKKAGETQTFSY